MAVTFESNWTGGIIGGIFGAIGERNKQEYINQAYENMWAAAVSKYNAVEDAVNISKMAAEAQMRDVIGELQRVGASYQREVEREGKKAVSKQRAAREGLTGGNTAIKQDIATQIKINRVAFETQEKSQSMINQVVDAKDKQINALNNKLNMAWAEMQGALAKEAPTSSWVSNLGNMLASTIKGFGQGWQLEGRIRDALRAPVEPTSYALSSAYTTPRPDYINKPKFVAEQLFIQ